MASCERDLTRQNGLDNSSLLFFSTAKSGNAFWFSKIDSVSAEIGEKIRQRKSLSEFNETPQSSLAFKPKSSQSRFTLVREKRQNLCTSSQPSSSSYFQKEEVKSCGSDAAKKSDKDVTFMSSRSSEEEPASTITTTIFNKNLPPEFVKVRECEEYY